MSWKKLKTFAIVVLCLMNLGFLFLIMQRNYRATHYEEELIDSVTNIFRESALYVDRSFLSGKVVSLPVYVGQTEQKASSELPVVCAIEKAGFELRKEPGGIRCENAVGEFYFGDDFGFYYMEKGRYDRPSELLTTERYILLKENTGSIADILHVVDIFLRRYEFLSEENSQYGYEIAYSEVYSSGVNYIVTLSQSINGVPVHEELCVMVSGGRVVSADGIFATESPVSREKAETVDIIDILFEEKAYLDAVYRENGSFAYTPMVLSDISYSYAVYFDAAGSFYLVPLCEVQYVNGDVRTYNCVSGKLYS